LQGIFSRNTFLVSGPHCPKRVTRGREKNTLPDNFKYDLAALKNYDPKLLSYSETAKFKTGLKEPFGLAVDKKEGLIFVVSTEGLLACNDKGTGKITGLPVKLENAGAAAFGASSALLLAGRDRVNIISKEILTFGKKGRGDGEFSFITAVKASDKYIFVADAGNRRISKFDLQGRFLGKIAGKAEGAGRGFIIPSPHMDIELDGSGELWVADTGRLQLENYSSEGVFLGAWGKHGVNIDEFIGCCNPVNFVIDREGNFVTAEKGVLRIKKYDRTGKFLGVVAGPGTFNEKNAGIPLAVDSKNRIYALDPVESTVRIFSQKQ